MLRRIFRASLLVAVIGSAGAPAIHAQDSNIQAAQASVEAWLSLVDGQNYAASWTAAAALFRNAVTRENWESAVQTARVPLGPLKSRTLKAATVTRTLPGAPDGEYVVFQFTASFERKAAALETVTALLEPDGTWHVSGYFVR